MEPIIFSYRSRDLTSSDINHILALIENHYDKGRTRISRILCETWNWKQTNGKLKEYAARDLLLRLEENGFIKLPPQIRPNNNHLKSGFTQIPLFEHQPLQGIIGDFPDPSLQRVDKGDRYLWKYLVHHYHYLGLPTLVGEHLQYLVTIQGQVVACLAWASAAFKVGSRDQIIGWNEATRRQNLHLVTNNTRFLILPWVRIRHLASKILAITLKRLNRDFLHTYRHPVYLAETFVDTSRFNGTCYQASNWQYAGMTKGSAKRGNIWRYHGQPKAVYLYPLHRHYRRFLNDEQG